jgi:hypothetical protein
MRFGLKILEILILLASIFLAACSVPIFRQLEATSPVGEEIILATETRISSSTPSRTPTQTGTASPIPSVTPTPTRTTVPTPTSTPVGGGSGMVVIYSCKDVDTGFFFNCTKSVVSLSGELIQTLERPEIRSVETTQEKTHLELYYPDTGNAKTIMECSEKYQVCSQVIVSGSLDDEWVYVAQEYQLVLFDDKSMIDLYRVNIGSGEQVAVGHFDGFELRFQPFLESSKGLLTYIGNVFMSELMIYDPETQGRQLIAAREGQFNRYGFSPDQSMYWYRITDYCETELVSSDGERIAKMANSSGILGWLDPDRFLLLTTDDNPPYCTPTGIAIANRYGLTGDWISQSRVSEYAQISPDGKKLVFMTNCNNNGCKTLMAANIDGSDPHLLIDSPDPFYPFRWTWDFSPDGKKYLFILDNKLMMVDLDGGNPQTLFETNEEVFIRFSFIKNWDFTK